MDEVAARVLVVEDNAVNRRLLARTLAEQGHSVATAENGREALDLLRARPHDFDIVLLDVLMPEMDGYETLARLKGDESLRHLPVIMVSAVEEMDSVIRCVEMGATDYLPKPFDAALLRARIRSSLAVKRLRDMELEYLREVSRLTQAAADIEAGAFRLDSLDAPAARPDALGQLARVFQNMAREVIAREERLKQQVRALRIEIDHARRAQKVAEITGTEYFKSLREQADELRGLVNRPPPDPA